MEQPENKSRPIRKWMLRIIAIVFAAVVLKILFVITARPELTIDYTAKYDELTKPPDYNPKKNAAPIYQKAFDTFAEMPESLGYAGIVRSFSPYGIDFPGDFDLNERKILEDWLVSNQEAFGYFERATQKPYYWIPRKDKDVKIIRNMKIPELMTLKNLSRTFLWNAKLKAYSGLTGPALEDTLDCYKAGIHKTQTPGLLMEQLLGMDIKRESLNCALIILDRTETDSSTLRNFQSSLQQIIDNDDFSIDLQAEKLDLLDVLQVTFSRNIFGADRLSFNRFSWFQCMCRESRYQWIYCFVGPTRSRIAQQIEKHFELHGLLKDKTPWQIHFECGGQVRQIEANCNSNYFTRLLFPGYKIILYLAQKPSGRANAVIAISGILRFKTDRGRFPASLEELVNTGYLKSVLLDPYSNGQFVYKVTDDNFKLYSLGDDFEDNNGEVFIPERPRGFLKPPGFVGFGPADANSPQGIKYPEPRPIFKDIIYWPVIRPEKLPERPRPPRRQKNRP